MIIRQTTPEEAPRVNELFAIAFEIPLSPCPADPGNPKVHHWAAFHGESQEMMSTFTISDHQIQFDGHSCKMGGIGGVATLPQYRRMGGIRGCFQEALPDMYRNGYDFSYLYPFSTAYYRKFGYECCVRRHLTTILLSLLNPEPFAGTFRLAEKKDPMTEAIRAIDQVWEQQFNMMVLHRETDYDWTTKTDPAGKLDFTYVCFASDGTPVGYTTFRTVNESDGRNLVCSRFCFTNKEGFTGLMHLFKSQASDHMHAKFPLPAIPAMQYLMREWSMGAAQWSIQNAGMVRVVNVENVLKKARYLGTGTVNLSITDPQIPENNGCFAVSFRDGVAQSVIRAPGSPDAILTIPAFSALISGVCDLKDAAPWMPGLEIINPAAPLSAVFYQKNMMVNEYF